MKTQMRFAADPQKRENPAEPASKACPPALGTHSAPLSVAADPSSAMFLPECSVAQQGIVTASKIASKSCLFQQTQLFGGHSNHRFSESCNQSLAPCFRRGVFGQARDPHSRIWYAMARAIHTVF